MPHILHETGDWQGVATVSFIQGYPPRKDLTKPIAFQGGKFWTWGTVVRILD